MKTILICPSQASGISVLADSRPVQTLELLGETFIGYWLHYLAAKNFKEVRILTTDSPEAFEELVGDGSRWGLQVEVLREVRELKRAEARARYRPGYETDWAPEPMDVIEADHLPGMPEHKLFSSYQTWFESLGLWLPHVGEQQRIGLRQLEPGVWAGRRARIASSATLHAPCWIGDNVRVGKNTVIGPNAFIEDQAVIDSACVVRNSWIGPSTFLGSLTELKDSLAVGDLLINWQSGSHTIVPDSFLLAPLKNQKRRGTVTPRESAAGEPVLERPVRSGAFSSVIALAQKLQS